MATPKSAIKAVVNRILKEHGAFDHCLETDMVDALELELADDCFDDEDDGSFLGEDD